MGLDVDLTNPDILLPLLKLLEKKAASIARNMTPEERDQAVATMMNVLTMGFGAAENFVNSKEDMNPKTKQKILGLLKMLKGLPAKPEVHKAVTVWLLTNYIPNFKKKCRAPLDNKGSLPADFVEPLNWEKILVQARRANAAYFCNRGSCKKCGQMKCTDQALKDACVAEVIAASNSDKARCMHYKNVDLIVGVDGDTQWIAIAGTNDAEDVQQDLTFMRYWDEKLGVGVHLGMHTYASNVWKLLQKANLDKSKPVEVTGHSLGGASAALIGLMLKRAGFNVPFVVSFGAPAFTEGRCAPIWEQEVPLLRVVNDGDAITATLKVGRWKMTGPELRLYGELDEVAETTYTYMSADDARDVAKEREGFGEQSLKAHDPGLYLKRIEHIAKNGAKKFVPPPPESDDDDDDE